jgi:hypothetical protein
MADENTIDWRQRDRQCIHVPISLDKFFYWTDRDFSLEGHALRKGAGEIRGRMAVGGSGVGGTRPKHALVLQSGVARGR